ncbi:hypothetical protein DID75_00950 [Candidatus Marinamargulisbacteria bacterium SCGC AG-410-N11]|nr:hypothetical protein DID75_00950 [Candidatus Marinamargulisbacteria bacterium SCGC AG-410-N11]
MKKYKFIKLTLLLIFISLLATPFHSILAKNSSYTNDVHSFASVKGSGYQGPFLVVSKKSMKVSYKMAQNLNIMSPKVNKEYREYHPIISKTKTKPVRIKSTRRQYSKSFSDVVLQQHNDNKSLNKRNRYSRLASVIDQD